MHKPITRRNFITHFATLYLPSSLILNSLLGSQAIANTTASGKLKKVLLPNPFEYLIVPGNEVASVLSKYRSKDSITPVVMGGFDKFSQQFVDVTAATFADIDSVDASIKKAQQLDVEKWIKQQIMEYPEDYADYLEESIVSKDTEVQQAGSLVMATGMLTGEMNPEIVIGLIPVKESWQVPSYLAFGGWNAVPMPEVQSAFFKRWGDQYGATVTTVAGDVVEFSVERPPTTDAEALTLAKEQFIYCPDTVFQGHGSVGDLAAALKGAASWFFWWD